MDTKQLLNRATAAKTLLAEERIQEAFATLIEDYKTALFTLEAGKSPEEIVRVHFGIKSLMAVKARLESYAGSEQHHRDELRREQS
jgi:hypothetical protein